MSSEKAEKAKISAQIKHVPKDAQVIMSILKELNIQEYEPRVVNQMLEFTFRKYCGVNLSMFFFTFTISVN